MNTTHTVMYCKRHSRLCDVNAIAETVLFDNGPWHSYCWSHHQQPVMIFYSSARHATHIDTQMFVPCAVSVIVKEKA